MSEKPAPNKQVDFGPALPVVAPSGSDAPAPALPGLPAPSRRNPYVDLMLQEPQVTQSDGVERSLPDRFRMNVEDAKRNSILGATEAAMYSHAPADIGDIADSVRGERIKRQAAYYEAMRPADTPLEYLAAGAGQIAGAAMSPESYLGFSGKFVQGGRWLFSRMFRAGVSGAAVNAGTDPLVQELRIRAGLQDSYSPRRTAMAAAMGFALPAVIQGGAEVARVAAGPRVGLAPEAGAVADAAPMPEAATPAPSVRSDPEAHADIAPEIAPALPERMQPAANAEAAPDVNIFRPGAKSEQTPAGKQDVTPVPTQVQGGGEYPVVSPSEGGPHQPVPEFKPGSVPPSPGKRAGVFLFNPRDLHVDAETFQFKSGGDTQGVTPILRGVTKWDPDAAGMLVVWERNDGALFVADGHQRTGLAKRMLDSGAENEIQIPGSLYREADGWTPESVMTNAAMKNIREGSGDVMDAARILRINPGSADQIAEIGRAQTRQAVALSGLSDDVWRMTVNEVIEPRDAAVIGRLIRNDDALQGAVAKLMARVRPSSEAEAEILVRRAKESALVRSEDASQGSMFGDLDSPESLVAEETRIVSQAVKVLSRDRNVLKRVAANADLIEQTGSKIERGGTVAAVDDAGRVSAMVEGMAFRRGPVRDKLLELAREMKDGRVSAGDAAQALIDALRHESRPGDGGGRPPRRRGPNDEGSGGSEVRPFIGHIRGRPLRGEPGREAAGVAVGQGAPEAERLKSISDGLISTLGLTVRQGRINKRGALGTYNEVSGVTRLKEADAFDVLAHEGGHAFHLRPENKLAVDRLIAAHASEVERLAYAGAKAGTERIEGFAEWFRLWVTNPNYAKREAPAFSQAFETWMQANRKATFDPIVAAQSAYRDWLAAPSRDVVSGDLVTSAAPPLSKRIGKALGTDRLPQGQSLFTLLDRFYTWGVDRLHPVNRAVRALAAIHERNTGVRLDIKAADDAYKLMRLATNSYQAGHSDLIRGVTPYHGTDPSGASLAEAIELALGKNWFAKWRSDELTDFGGYLVARRSIQEFQRFLAGEVPNPPGKLTLGDYHQAVRDYEAAHPNFAAAAKLAYEWQTNLLQKKFEAGLISRTYLDTALSRADYVPFQRDFADKIEDGLRSAGTAGTNRQSVMKTYRGSTRSIINPLESMMSDAYDTAAIIARNDAIKAMARLARDAGPDGGAIAELVPSKQLKPVRVDVVEALRAAGKDAGIDKQDLDQLILSASETLDTDQIKATLFRAGDAPEKGEPIVYFWEGGERKALRLADARFGKELYQAVTGLGAEQSNWIIDLLAIPARAQRFSITTHPTFLVANYIRDQTSAFILNGKFVPFYSGARGAAAELAQGRTAQLYSRIGGIMGGAETASLNEARIGRDISALQRRGYSIQRLKDPRELLKLTEISETGTRLALFKQYFDTARKNGLSEYEAMVEGAFQARDFMDFGRHGSKMLMARRLVTFLNAALQGADKTGRVLLGQLRPLARVFRGEPLNAAEKAGLGQSAQAWAKLSAITALSATYAVMYRDEPEFQQASEYLRATNWLFKGSGGNWYAVPKPFEMATLFNLGERAAEAIFAHDPTWAEKWIRSWSYTLAIPTEPTGLMAPAEIFFNYDTFRDRPIVQQWDLGKDPALQFDSFTSAFSKKVGQVLGVSPAKVDHLLLGWGGSWARDALAATSAVADPQRRSSELYDWPLTSRFVKNLARGSVATTKFYQLVSETGGRLEQKNNSYADFLNRGQEAPAADYYAGLKDDEKVWVSLNQLSNADNKRLHPLRRAADIASVYGGMKRDITNRNIVSVIGGRKIEINPTIASAIQDQLGRAAATETRNALITVGEPGWAGRQIIDPSPNLSAIKTLSPEVAQEVEDRLRKKKVLPFAGVQQVWPELRDRLLKDGPQAFVGDLRAKALLAGQ